MGLSANRGEEKKQPYEGYEKLISKTLCMVREDITEAHGKRNIYNLLITNYDIACETILKGIEAGEEFPIFFEPSLGNITIVIENEYDINGSKIYLL